MQRKKFFYLLFLFAAVILLTSCGVASINPDEEWSTYINQIYGYTFLYPPDCSSGPLPADCKKASTAGQPSGCSCFLDTQNPDRVMMQRLQMDGDQQVLAEFSITNLKVVGDIPSDQASLMDWLGANFPTQWERAEHQKIAIDGHAAVRLSIPKSDMAPAREEIYIIMKDDLFQISMLSPDLNINSQLYERILASFHYKS